MLFDPQVMADIQCNVVSLEKKKKINKTSQKYLKLKVLQGGKDADK
jgi:hypothetical protein